MAEFAQLMTKITADNKDFLSKVNQASKTAGDFGKRMLKIGAIGAGVIAGTLTVAFAGLLHVVNDTADEIDRLAKMASKFGGEVESFQKLEFAAKLSGVSMGTLNAGMSRLVRTVDSAAQGNKAAVESLNALGLSARQLQSMSIDKQYIAISDALKTIPDQNKQAALAVQIFGRAGVEQLNLLRADLNETFADFDKFGAALTGKQAKAVEAYNDSLTRLGAIFDAFKIQLTAAVAPALESIVNWIGDSVIAMGGLGEAGKQAGLFMVDAMLLGVKAFQGILNFIDAIIGKFETVKLKALEVAQTFDNMGFAITGGEINFERGLEIAKLQKSIAERGNGSEFTSGLQGKLRDARSAVANASSNSSQKGTIDVKITAAEGLKADVKESPETTRIINLMVRQIMAKESTGVAS